MSSPYNPPVKGQDFFFRLSLSDMATAGAFRANPTIAAGDFKIDKDGTGLVNVSVLPLVEPAGSVLVRVALTSTEMNADVVTLVGIDQTIPKEWADFVITIPTVLPGELGTPLILEADGITHRSLIMKHTEATGGLILTMNTSSVIPPYILIGGVELNTGVGQRPVYIGGGGFGEKDATEIRFYTDPTLGAGNNEGILRFMIDQNGTIIFSSGQLKFPATQNPSSDPNTLDDYEEGTFTPTLTATTAPAGVTYTTQVGKYTKVGRSVHITDLNCVTSSNGTGSGPMKLGGLPFASAVSFVSAPLQFFGINLSAGFFSCFLFGSAGSTATLTQASNTGSQIFLPGGGVDTAVGSVTWENLGPTTSLFGSFSYSTV